MPMLLDIFGPFIEYTNSIVNNDLPSPNVLTLMMTIALVLRFFHFFTSMEVPKVTVTRKKCFIKELISGIQMLKEPYCPPALWGRSGHIQTAAYGLLGHSTLKRSYDRRVSLKLSDGSTSLVDIFEPLNKHPIGCDVTLALVPGIANTSESNYIRTCVHYAQERGYRCAVLNHLGALPDVQLTGNRIFSYGGTEEAEMMMKFLVIEYPSTKFINIGFSMGGNITTLLLLRLSKEIRKRVILGLSVGQGYSANDSAPMYHEWENCRRAYNYMITENMKRLLRRNYHQAVVPHVESGLIDEERLWSSTSIITFDEHYSLKVFGQQSLHQFYECSSCLSLLRKLDIPMIFVNSEDDPIVPRSLWACAQKLAEEKEDLAFISTRHGGHLGFLEGSSFSPNSRTWLDRLIIELSERAVIIS